jgi:hypothetical protein
LVKAKVRNEFRTTVDKVIATIDSIAKSTLNDECMVALNEFNKSNTHTQERKHNDNNNAKDKTEQDNE